MFAHRKYLLALVVLLVTVMVMAVNSTWAAAAGLDVWNVPELQREIALAEQHNRALAAADDEVRQHIVAKEQLIDELIAGRTTLVEVTAAFLAINERFPVCMNAIRQHFAGATDFEKHARNVVSFTNARFEGETLSQQAVARARLEAELQQLLQDRANPPNGRFWTPLNSEQPSPPVSKPSTPR